MKGPLLLARAADGASAGLVATAPMTASMLLFHRVGLLPQLPPFTIVDRLAPATPFHLRRGAGLAAHGAYGAAAGVAYALLTPGPPRRRGGMVFGFLVWLAGYEGWVPLMRILPPAHRDDRGRVLSVLTAHLLFGVAVAAFMPDRRRR